MTPLLHELSDLFRPSSAEVVRLPILVVVHPGAASTPLDTLQELLDRAGDRRVPYARVDATDYTGPDGLRELLVKLSNLLAPARYGAPRLRFEHLDLLDWVMRQDLSDGDTPAVGRPDELVRRLRDRGRPAGANVGGQPAIDAAARSANRDDRPPRGDRPDRARRDRSGGEA